MTDTLVQAAALMCVVAGMVAGAAVGVAARDAILALRVALEFWLAAGLLNLTTAHDWSSLAVAALIVVVRQTASRALRHPPVRSEPARQGRR